MRNSRSKQPISVQLHAIRVAWWDLASRCCIPPRTWVIHLSSISALPTLPACQSLSGPVSCQVSHVVSRCCGQVTLILLNNGPKAQEVIDAGNSDMAKRGRQCFLWAERWGQHRKGLCEEERDNIHITLILVYCYNCFILLLVTVVNLLLYLTCKLNFIIGMYA